MLRHLGRVMGWTALLAVAFATAAVVLVMRGDDGDRAPVLIATALAAGIAVLLGAGAMALAVLRRPSSLSKDKDI